MEFAKSNNVHLLIPRAYVQRVGGPKITELHDRLPKLVSTISGLEFLIPPAEKVNDLLQLVGIDGSTKVNFNNLLRYTLGFREDGSVAPVKITISPLG